MPVNIRTPPRQTSSPSPSVGFVAVRTRSGMLATSHLAASSECPSSGGPHRHRQHVGTVAHKREAFAQKTSRAIAAARETVSRL